MGTTFSRCYSTLIVATIGLDQICSITIILAIPTSAIPTNTTIYSQSIATTTRSYSTTTTTILIVTSPNASPNSGPNPIGC